MTEQQLAERVLELCRSADRLRMPDHRHTAESFLADRDHHRDGVRRLYRDLTGAWPDQGDAGPPRRVKPPVPAAVLRHRARLQAARTA